MSKMLLIKRLKICKKDQHHYNYTTNFTLKRSDLDKDEIENPDLSSVDNDKK